MRPQLPFPPSWSKKFDGQDSPANGWEKYPTKPEPGHTSEPPKPIVGEPVILRPEGSYVLSQKPKADELLKDVIPNEDGG